MTFYSTPAEERIKELGRQLAAAHAEVERLRAERNELNATLDEKARSHAELLIAWYKLTGDWDRVTQENAELRRGQYVPVEDGFEYECGCSDCVDDEGDESLWRHKIYVNGQEVGICYVDESDDGHYVYLPDQYRLCRLAPQHNAELRRGQYVPVEDGEYMLDDPNDPFIITGNGDPEACPVIWSGDGDVAVLLEPGMAVCRLAPQHNTAPDAAHAQEQEGDE